MSTELRGCPTCHKYETDSAEDMERHRQDCPNAKCEKCGATSIPEIFVAPNGKRGERMERWCLGCVFKYGHDTFYRHSIDQYKLPDP